MKWWFSVALPGKRAHTLISIPLSPWPSITFRGSSLDRFGGGDNFALIKKGDNSDEWKEYLPSSSICFLLDWYRLLFDDRLHQRVVEAHFRQQRTVALLALSFIVCSIEGTRTCWSNFGISVSFVWAKAFQLLVTGHDTFQVYLAPIGCPIGGGFHLAAMATDIQQVAMSGDCSWKKIRFPVASDVVVVN